MRFEPIHIGVDFNVSHMAGVASELIDNRLYVMKEFIDLLDTPELIKAIEEAFPRRKVICYPDSSGKNRSSQNANSSDIALLRAAKFTIRARSINPPVKDRVASVNRAFEQGKLFINTEACPELTECLEQQVYKENGQPDKESGVDHALDALGYKVYYIMPVESRAIKTIGVSH